MRASLAFAALALTLPCLALAGAPSWQPSGFTESIIMGVSMSDATTGFAAGGMGDGTPFVMKTTDAGKSWNPTKAWPELILMAVSAKKDGKTVIADGLGMGSGSIEYTADGETFTNSSQPDVSMQQTQAAASIQDDPQGFAVAGTYNFWKDNATINGAGFSYDGGKTWTYKDIHSPQETPARYGSFPSSSVGFITSGQWPPNAKVESHTFPLTRNIHVHHAHGNHAAAMRVNKNKRASDSGWLGAISRSTDGFDTWTTVYTNTSFYFNEISCPSETVCYAAAENDDVGFGFMTTDGGDTWNQVLAAPGVSMMSAQAVSETEGYFGGGVLGELGINGTVYHTADGGKTFDTTIVPGYYFTSLAMVSNTFGVATAMDEEQQCDVLVYSA